ncbi:MAG: transcription initiation factor TFIIIB [Oscillibacter sp.]|nr:transcription initiation factor TFIIIB [Oscillibacter sp.]
MENRKCPKCGSEDIMNGNLTSPYGFVFIPDTQKSLVKKSSYIVCSACKECGSVFDLTLTDKPNKLTHK